MSHQRLPERMHSRTLVAVSLCAALIGSDLWAQERDLGIPVAEAMRPFWLDSVMRCEPVLFIRDEATGESRGSLLFFPERIIAVTDSSGDIRYEPAVDFRFDPGTREVIIPKGSRVVTKAAADLRRPAGSQRYRLTHRDGGDEILFGAELEYHRMQTWVTYAKSGNDWPIPMPTFDPERLPVTIEKLVGGKKVTIVVLGDSISTGCNASGWADGAPHQHALQSKHMT